MATNGGWLEIERRATWVAIGDDKSIEISQESCFVSKERVWFVLRALNNNVYRYMGCYTDNEEEVFVPISRQERLSGEIVGEDNLNFTRALKVTKMKFLSKAIIAANNWSSFNSYQTPPPFVIFIMMKLEDSH